MPLTQIFHVAQILFCTKFDLQATRQTDKMLLETRNKSNGWGETLLALNY